MFNDRLKTGFFAGDKCLAYKYHDRRDINLDGLACVRVNRILSSDKNGVMVDGTEVSSGENFAGFAVYKFNGCFLETGEGLKYMSYFQKGKGFGRCLRKAGHGEYFRLELVFMLKKEAEVSVDAFPGMLFSSEDDAMAFAGLCSFKKACISLSGVSLIINGEPALFPSYRIYAGGMEYQSETSGEEFMKLMFGRYGGADYLHQASFSLRLVSYEFIPVQVP